MSVSVKYFASIREQLGRDGDVVDSVGTAAEVWQRAAGLPWRDNTLVAINQEYARRDDPVRDGDEVAFFPPVTGG